MAHSVYKTWPYECKRPNSIIELIVLFCEQPVDHMSGVRIIFFEITEVVKNFSDIVKLIHEYVIWQQ